MQIVSLAQEDRMPKQFSVVSRQIVNEIVHRMIPAAMVLAMVEKIPAPILACLHSHPPYQATYV
jgi:hypothetical protein